MNNTADVRKFLNDTIKQMQSKEISNAIARSRLMAAKIYIDTVKVDVAAIHLGITSANSLTFNDGNNK